MTNWERYCTNCHHTYPLKQNRGTPKQPVTKYKCAECGQIGMKLRKAYPMRFWPGQRELVQFRANGKGYKEIAQLTGLSLQLIWARLYRLRKKLGALDDCNLVAIALRNSWIE